MFYMTLMPCEQNAGSAIHGRIKYINRQVEGSSEREQLTKPFRIKVTKSEVTVRYPLTDIKVSTIY